MNVWRYFSLTATLQNCWSGIIYILKSYCKNIIRELCKTAFFGSLLLLKREKLYETQQLYHLGGTAVNNPRLKSRVSALESHRLMDYEFYGMKRKGIDFGEKYNPDNVLLVDTDAMWGDNNYL